MAIRNSALAFFRVGEGLDLVERCLVQVNVLAERPHVAWLLSDDLCRGILNDPRAMLVRLVGSADKIFMRLANTPYAGIALARRAKELHDNRG
jgi:hypothetical protein